jgi:ERCC4-type nuclease
VAENKKFTVLIDSREQDPFVFFDGDKPILPNIELVTRVTTLHDGDYTIDGFSDNLRIERKSLGDYVSTVIQGWLPFTHRLKNLGKYDYAAIFVEASLSDILNQKYYGKAEPASVLGKTFSIVNRYRIPVFFADDKASCSKAALHWLIYSSRLAKEQGIETV